MGIKRIERIRTEEIASAGVLNIRLPLASFPISMWVDVCDIQPGYVPARPTVPTPSSRNHTVHPQLLRSSFPSPTLHIHPHHSFPFIFFIPSHDKSVPL